MNSRYLLLLSGILILNLTVSCKENNMAVKRVSNPSLKTIAQSGSWQGTPVNDKGMFINIDANVVLHFSSVLKWMVSKNPQKEEKKNDPWHLEVVHNNEFVGSSEDMIVWLGHASFYIRLNGIVIITDPILFDVPFLKRKSGFALRPDEYGKIDYILVSHNHRDHCDKKSIKFLAENNQNLEILCGLGLDKQLKGSAKDRTIQSAGWYQQFETDTSVIKIYFLPAHHWSKRGLFDTNETLWGAFVIQTEKVTIYFAGDTGNGIHFEQASSLFPTIDYCLLPVGAYKPQWLMSPQHMSPNNAVEAFNQLNGKIFIPMHYGTYDLSDEPLGEPLRILNSLKNEHKINGELKVLKIGEVNFLH